MERHHKALDMMFAKILPEEFAKRYMEFWPSDIDVICETCHKNYHLYVMPMTAYFHQSHQQFVNAYYFTGNKISRSDLRAFLMTWKRQFKKAYDTWKKKEKMKHVKA